MVPSGRGDEGVGGGEWTDSGDGFNDSSSSASPEAGNWSAGGPNHPTFCFFKGVADGLAGGLMGSVFGFGNSSTKLGCVISSCWSLLVSELVAAVLARRTLFGNHHLRVEALEASACNVCVVQRRRWVCL